MAGALLPHVMGGNTPELRIDERDQLLPRASLPWRSSPISVVIRLGPAWHLKLQVKAQPSIRERRVDLGVSRAKIRNGEPDGRPASAIAGGIRGALARAVRSAPTYLAHACANDPGFSPKSATPGDAHEEARSFLDHPLRCSLRQRCRRRVSPAPIASRGAPARRRRHGRRLRGGRSSSRRGRRAEDPAAAPTPADLYRLKTGVPKPRRRGAPESGVPLRALRRGRAAASSRWSSCRASSFVDYVRGSGRRPSMPIDRLMPALRQLVDGVSALHGGQAPPRHQAVERAGDAGGPRRRFSTSV